MTTKFYLPSVLAAEHELALHVARIMRFNCDPIEPTTEGLKFQQIDAVKLACTRPFSIICGRPGTGKTTTLKRVVDSFSNAGMKGTVACSTGKAAKRAHEVINDTERKHSPDCLTIHRLLKFSMEKGGFTFGFENPLELDYLIIEETSMAGCFILRDALEAVDSPTRIVVVGDPWQLPSVEPGNVLHDFIMSNVIPKTELTHIFRQGANSGIVYNASRILNGEPLVRVDPRTGEDFTDFYFVPRIEPEETFATILSYVTEKIPNKRNYDPVTDIQCLSPGKKSVVGVKHLNDHLRDKLNPGKGKGKQWRGFYVGDKVINRKNYWDLDIVNGDVGKVVEVGDNGVTIDFAGVGRVELDDETATDLYLAYCFTAHSSQGSEFPVVICPIHKCHHMLLFRNMLYTAVTRAKQLTVVIGDPLAVTQCINNSVTEKRVTGLQKWLRKYVKPDVQVSTGKLSHGRAG